MTDTNDKVETKIESQAEMQVRIRAEIEGEVLEAHLQADGYNDENPDVHADQVSVGEDTSTEPDASRSTRINDSREFDAREYDSQFSAHDNPYKRLSAPPKRKGMEQRWVNVYIPGSDGSDIKNISYKTKIGWKPRPLDSIPENYLMDNELIKASGDKGVYRMGEHVLMEMPTELFNNNLRLKAKRVVQQHEGLAEQLKKDEVPGHSIEREETTTVQRGGKLPAVQGEAF